VRLSKQRLFNRRSSPRVVSNALHGQRQVYSRDVTLFAYRPVYARTANTVLEIATTAVEVSNRNNNVNVYRLSVFVHDTIAHVAVAYRFEMVCTLSRCFKPNGVKLSIWND
jgi:hypothetical protein